MDEAAKEEKAEEERLDALYKAAAARREKFKRQKELERAKYGFVEPVKKKVLFRFDDEDERYEQEDMESYVEYLMSH
ncbi:hypothetical protein HK101_000228 [Irineochytrium annulatum]|nr:hypothetical protein HK101_000228 [Irineochytrium annulatum]